jgi:glucosamine--fructose-6-phosphate aminotransferase (isomerizing)
LGTIASAALEDLQPRFVLVASSTSACSALFGALMLNETAKLPAEAFLGGEFRHGPIELAGPGLTAVLFGSGVTDPSLTGLGEDLLSSGSRVLHLDPGPSPVGCLSVSTNATGPLGRAVCGAKLGQLLSVELARARGIEPGVFRFGSKITTSL